MRNKTSDNGLQMRFQIQKLIMKKNTESMKQIQILKGPTTPTRKKPMLSRVSTLPVLPPVEIRESMTPKLMVRKEGLNIVKIPPSTRKKLKLKKMVHN